MSKKEKSFHYALDFSSSDIMSLSSALFGRKNSSQNHKKTELPKHLVPNTVQNTQTAIQKTTKTKKHTFIAKKTTKPARVLYKKYDDEHHLVYIEYDNTGNGFKDLAIYYTYQAGKLKSSRRLSFDEQGVVTNTVNVIYDETGKIISMMDSATENLIKKKSPLEQLKAEIQSKKLENN